MHPEGAQVGALLQAPHRFDGSEIHLAHAGRPTLGPVLEPLEPLLAPTPQCPVNGRLARPEVGGDALGRPPLGVQPDDGNPALARLVHLVVRAEAADHPEGSGLLREDPPDRMLGRTPAEPHVADPGDLAQAQSGPRGLEVDDEAPHGGRQLTGLGTLRIEEAAHALLVEALYPSVQRPLGDAHLAGTLRHRRVEEYERTDCLVALLLGPLEKRYQPLPFVGWFGALAPVPAHGVPPSLRRRGRGRMPLTGAHCQSPYGGKPGDDLPPPLVHAGVTNFMSRSGAVCRRRRPAGCWCRRRALPASPTAS